METVRNTDLSPLRPPLAARHKKQRNTRAGGTTSQTAAPGDKDTPDEGTKGFYTAIDEEEEEEGKLYHITIICLSFCPSQQFHTSSTPAVNCQKSAIT